MIIDTIWQDFLKIVREEAGSRVVETWFNAVKLSRWDAYQKIAYLEAPNPFVKQWVSSHYNGLFTKHLGRLLSEDSISVVFVENGACRNLPSVKKINGVDGSIGSNVFYKPAKPLTNTSKKVRSRALVKRSCRVRGVLNSNYIFDSFVVGASNTLAFSAARAAAENSGNLYNPLFIYGSSGLGKTHLLHAFGNHIRSTNKKSIILYQSADRFVRDFISAIRFNKIYQFESRYKDIDVLLMDDIQFISNKEQTQEMFFHIFNTLHQDGKQIVFTSDSMPCDIAGLAERMRSRLEGGLVADIQEPSPEMMVAILQKKAELNDQALSPEIAHFIAAQGCTNVRELEGMLIRITAFASLVKQPLTLELARRVLSSRNGKKKADVGLQMVASVVCKNMGYSLKDMRSTSRNKELTRVRHVAMYLMKKLTGSSFREIGIFLGRKDHSTVIHALEKIEKTIKKDDVFSEEVKKLERKITT